MPPPLLNPTSTPVTHHAIGLETPPRSSPSSQPHLRKHRSFTPVRTRPTQFTFTDGPRDAPGTAAYYKSWIFRCKVKKGRVLVPGQEGSGGGDRYGDGYEDCSADEDYDKRTKDKGGRKSLVMVLSRTSARRAAAGRKVDRRMKCANRRLKFLRKLEGVACLFEWD